VSCGLPTWSCQCACWAWCCPRTSTGEALVICNQSACRAWCYYGAGICHHHEDLSPSSQPQRLRPSPRLTQRGLHSSVVGTCPRSGGGCVAQRDWAKLPRASRHLHMSAAVVCCCCMSVVGDVAAGSAALWSGAIRCRTCCCQHWLLAYATAGSSSRAPAAAYPVHSS
jgi:hypothetical protein